MDVNDLRSLMTVVSMIAFLGIVVWAWSRNNRAAFDEAAQLPFVEEDGGARQRRKPTMSDFINNGWSIYIAAVVIPGLVAASPAAAGHRQPAQGHGGGDNTTGHVWDEDLRELNNPLPRWWMGLFVITVVFAVLYLALYPGLGSFGGQLGWTFVGQLRPNRPRPRRPWRRCTRSSPARRPRRSGRRTGRWAIGERLFINNCAQCHGSDAKGSKGFPNLTDGGLRLAATDPSTRSRRPSPTAVRA